MICAIIVAGGEGRRFKNDIVNPTGAESILPKQFLMLGDKPVYLHSIERLASVTEIDYINIVVPEEYIERVEDEIKQCRIDKVAKILAGGERRQDSVWNGLNSVSPQTEIVLIHDGVRPFPPVEATRKAIELAREIDAVILAQPSTDTVKIVSEQTDDTEYYLIEKTLSRHQVWLAQTPQVFRYSLIKKAYQEVMARNIIITDEAQAVELIGEKVYIIPGTAQNIKITTPTDLAIAQTLLSVH